MKYITYFMFIFLISCSDVDSLDKFNWPMAGGNSGSWQGSGKSIATTWSVALGENILWRQTLPEGGQSGIAVWGDRIFFTIMKPVEWDTNKGKLPKDHLKGNSVLAYCMEADTGKTLWTRELVGGKAYSVYMSGFSDSSTPTPVTDGKMVWFSNASGCIKAFDFEGNMKWERQWEPVTELKINEKKVRFPFNKQFEPIISGSYLLNCEPVLGEDPKRPKGWNYIYGLNKLTGKVEWISEEALTHYNTPIFGYRADGLSALVIGRGGYHKVPEKPKGLSMISLDPSNAGQSLWRYNAGEKGDALYNSIWDENRAYWFSGNSVLKVLDSKTGKLVKNISLTHKVDVRSYNQETKSYELEPDINIEEKFEGGVFPAWYSNIQVGEWYYFMCFKKGKYRKNVGPDYSIARVHVANSKVEYLEVPVLAIREKNKPELLIWNEERTTSTKNSRGLDVASDARSRRDGWHWCFNGSPIAINGKIIFTTMLGTSYVIDGYAKILNKDALLGVNDLGPAGETWTVNSPSYANGRLYHRSLKEIVCISAVEK